MSASDHAAQRTPPSLPPRQQSDESLNVPPSVLRQPRRASNGAPMESYHSHLQKHVRSVRRRTKHTPPPTLASLYQANESMWLACVHYLQAWLSYWLEVMTSDQVDDQLEPFSYHVVKSAANRLYKMVVPWLSLGRVLIHVTEWRSVPLTGGLFSVFLYLWWYGYLMVFVCGWIMYHVFMQRISALADVAFEMDDESATSNNLARDKAKFVIKRLFRGSHSPDVQEDDNHSLEEWIEIVGPPMQLLLLDVIDKLERIKNLMTWKRPAQTRILLCVMGVLCICFWWIPAGCWLKWWQLYMGLEFFVLQGLRTAYPTHRRLFNSIDWVLCHVPNDAEYALEMISKQSSVEPLNLPPLTTTSTTSSFVSSLSSSSSLLLPIPTSSDTLASIRNHMPRYLDSQDPTDDLTTLYKSHPSFACMYHGHIPGRLLVISDIGIQFRSSRWTGQS
ncbi:hypothetical protein DM01DRAFT_1204679 [Hesseltinella vesiculosa]|uniref:Uncharacterized protein n=1 Tax=Hesseltinella vesiculosa TaxID=101127 RepID=A0A1X2GPJ4_9FUNG|nr:hypothetical protein DM01DRAFT_1204679 [Hesseltinella vesiculosa]